MRGKSKLAREEPPASDVGAGTPRISVVVPTYRRSHLLPGLLEALGCQEGIHDYEAILVDDSSGDETEEVLDRLQSQASFPVRVLRSSRNAGPARARNLGWRAAKASVVAFTDDDCLPDPRWLAVLSEALARSDVVQGLTEVDPEGAVDRGPFARTMIIDRFSWKFETCNIAYRRDALESLRGFDERFPGPYGEDCDLGWRATKAGLSLAWAPGAVVLHRVETTGSRLGDWMLSLKKTRWTRYASRMVKMHPQMRRNFSLRIFYQPYHLPAIAAVAGLGMAVGSRRRPRAALLGLAMTIPWLRYRLVVDRPPARGRWLWAVLPMALAIDIAEVGSVLEGSVRHKTLLL